MWYLVYSRLGTMSVQYKLNVGKAKTRRSCRYAQHTSDQISCRCPITEFKELVEYCSEKKLELLIGSDAIAQPTVWGSSNKH